ncbi:hypothetical protein LIER_37795 [Lithospermum erythrorhizon]|uniref:Uncharacterized protein n=1 Tax=Lithospermum erythrorhizon TaxID=34254 RepID=A0AAV3PR89_LITER
MVAEPWILKLGNQVSKNFKNALHMENSKNLYSSGKKQAQEKKIIGILSFEIANVMSKIIHLHTFLTDKEISALKNEILKSVGIKTLVSDDENMLLELVVKEKLEDLNRVASVVSRLGKKCTIPALQGFEHVYGDIVSRKINVRELGFLVKDMDGMVRKLERYVSSTASLYSELEVLNELELATKKFQQNHNEESRKAFEQKVVWQKEDVTHLKNVSLWNQTYDKAVELLVRSVCTIYARITVVFGDAVSSNDSTSGLVSGVQIGASRILHSGKQDFGQKCSQANSEIIFKGDMMNPVLSKNKSHRSSGFIERSASVKRDLRIRPHVGPHRSEGGLFGPDDFNFACGIGPGRLFMECLSLSSSASKVDDDNDDVGYDDQSSQISGCFSVTSGAKREQPDLSGFFDQSLSRQSKGATTNVSKLGTKSRILVHASPNTVGGSALALHYANIIIVIEKLLRYPHLVGEEARDDLYQMLPISVRKTLKSRLRSYVKSLAIYDAPLAHDWKAKIEVVLQGIAPLAHNMIRWQSEHNFEQHQIVKRTNVLLIQTLYFADRIKTEDAICEVLVGLNYVCRYELQQNALLDCTSSFDLEENMDWQMEFCSPLHS